MTSLRKRLNELTRVEGPSPQDFLSTPTARRFAFGVNAESRAVARNFELAGIVDDRFEGKSIDGVPVLRSAALEPGALVVNCVSGVKPISVQRMLAERGVANLHYFRLLDHAERALKIELPDVMCWRQAKLDLKQNLERYQEIHDRLADERSREEFARLLAFRESGDLRAMQGFSDRQHEQYFDPVVRFEPSGEVFADIGGFDGATSLEFARRCPGYRQIDIFEPSPENRVACQNSLRHLERVNLHPCGLSDKTAILAFHDDGSSSRVGDEGDMTVDVRRLDDIKGVPSTFLKMDIEGIEVPALIGGEASIREHRPKMAICVYHKGDDFWRIPELANQMLGEHDIHLRHYTEGTTETVMYFIPR